MTDPIPTGKAVSPTAAEDSIGQAVESRGQLFPSFIVQPPRSQLGVVTELTKAAAWPIALLFVLLVFWAPLHRVADRVPGLIDTSDSITISDFSIKLNQHLRGEASPEVSKALAAMSPDSIRNLLNQSSGSSYWENSDPEAIARSRAQNAELVALGLLEEMSESE